MPEKKRPLPAIELDLGRYELRRDGRRVRLEKKPMELLILLVGRREQLVTRREIIGKLWRSGLFVDAERNINNIVRKIRAALGDSADRPRFLETVVGKGYRLVGPIQVIGAGHAPGQRASGTPNWEGNESQRTSMAVMPLITLGNATDELGLSLGFADAIVARLGNLQGIDVLPISSVLHAPANALPAENAARLGARFLVHGAIQMTKGVWRLSIEMFDAHLDRACFARRSDLNPGRLPELESEVARQIAAALNRPLSPTTATRPPRYSNDPMAYAEFMRGYAISSAGDPSQLDAAAQYLANAVTRDPRFSLAHAALSLVCATRHFEYDPGSVWLERAEFHGKRALELDPELAEGHLANAFLLWGPSKNFQHLEAIAELKRSLALQSNQPQAYNRLGTILAHIGLLDHAQAMYERGRHFHPKKAMSHSVVQVYMWQCEFEKAWRETQDWLAENPKNKYPAYFGYYTAMMMGEEKRAQTMREAAMQYAPDDPMVVSLEGVSHAMAGREQKAIDYMSRACANPKSFGHSHHTYYQIACILALLGKTEAAFGWLEKSVTTGFACWPFFLKDPCLKNLREHAGFEVVVSSLQAKYPDVLGLL